MFLTPSFADKNAVLSQFIISIVTSAIFSLVFPLSVWIRRSRTYESRPGMNGING